MALIADEKQDKLRLVTILTLLRFPLVLLFFAGAIVYVRHRHTWLFVSSFLALVASAATDLLDGYLARKFNVETDFGAHVDPLMDKFFYLATFPLMVFVATINGHITHAIVLLVLTVLFLTRDQWVTFLRSIGSIYNVSGCANWSGKLRTALNFPLVCAVYYFEEAPRSLRWGSWALLYMFEILAVIVNLISLYVYTRHYWPYLRRSAVLKEKDKLDI